jgi:cobalt-zinc-cadmium efflux system membrane fusion protein
MKHSGTPESPKARAQQVRGLAVAAGVLALLAFGGYLWSRRLPPEQPAKESAANTFQPSPQQLKTLTIETVAERPLAAAEIIDGKIDVDPNRSTPVYSPFSGRIVQLHAAIGDSVREGASLATVDASEYAQAANDLAAAAAQVKLTRAAETRKRALLETQGASLAEVQQAEADRVTADAGLAAVENRLRILGRSDAEIEALKRGASTRSTVALKSPINGVVIDRQAGPGQYVQAASGTPIYTIADTRSVQVIGQVPESESATVARGQNVEIRVAAWPDRVFRSTLSTVAATVDPATHRLIVRAELPNPDGALKPQMLATVRILTSDLRPTVAVPEGAVVYEGDHAHVWTVDDKNLISMRNVRTGRPMSGFVEIVDGLKPGERIVTRGSLFIDRAAHSD